MQPLTLAKATCYVLISEWTHSHTKSISHPQFKALRLMTWLCSLYPFSFNGSEGKELYTGHKVCR